MPAVPQPSPQDNVQTAQGSGRGHVFLKPDLFAKKAESVRDRRQAQLEGNEIPRVQVRRPYSGIVIKENTPSVLSIYKQDSDIAIPLVTSGAAHGEDPGGNLLGLVRAADEGQEDVQAKYTQDYADYIIQNVEERRAEKQQIVDTFGDTYIFFYGEQPRVVNFSGILVNTKDFNWRSQFWHNYDKYLRGTKLVEQNARAYISFDTIVVEGYPLSAGATESSEAPNVVQFQLSMFVTNYYDFSGIGIPFTYESRRHQEIEEANWDYLNRLGTQLAGVTPEGGVRDQFSQETADLSAFIDSLQGGVLDPISLARKWVSDTRYALHHKLAEIRRNKAVAGIGNMLNQGAGLIDDLKLLYQAAQQFTGTFATYGVPLLANSAAFASDPEGMIKYALGIGSPPGFAYEFAIDRALQSLGNNISMSTAILEGLGTPDNVKAAAIRSVGPIMKTDPAAIGSTRRSSSSSESGASSSGTSGNIQDGGYLGHKASQEGRTFSKSSAGLKLMLEAGQPVSVAPGQAYGSYSYQAAPGGTIDYESVYEDRDYEQVIADDPTISQTLREAYGDVDTAVPIEPDVFEEDTDFFASVAQEFTLSDVGADVDPSAIEEVYKTGVSSRYVLTTQQIHYILDLIKQKVALFSDEDTVGIRGVDDDDAQIDPVA